MGIPFVLAFYLFPSMASGRQKLIDPLHIVLINLKNSGGAVKGKG
jgi:hypothetical protein